MENFLSSENFIKDL